MHSLRFWVRWSARDLRRRWAQVVAVALILAVGSGLYAGLGSTSAWRQESNDASYDALHMYDVRVRLTAGSLATQGALLDVIGHLPHAQWVAVAEERLILSTQVDASLEGKTILVPGRLVGVDTRDGGPNVNSLYVTHGTGDLAPNTAVLDHAFNKFYKLPAHGNITVGRGHKLRYTGTGMSPETFLVTSERGDLLAEANLAVVFVSLDTAQAIANRPGQVNDLVIRMSRDIKDRNRKTLATEVEKVFAELRPELGVTVMGPEDDDVYRILYEDAETDQQMWNVFALLILGGAALAAFNLANRMVESQRREIGIGMALGVRPAAIALRPLLVGVEIGLLALIFGAGVGLLFAQLMKSLFTSMLPLPVWHMRFQVGYFARASALGLVIPVLAGAWPVWRAIRVAPIDAIRTGSSVMRGNGLVTLLRRVPLPGRTFAQMPVRNVLRTPRRTLTTAFGIGAAVTTIVATLGLLDTLLLTVDRADREMLQNASDRLTVDLDGFLPINSKELDGIRAVKQVGTVEPGLRVGGMISSDAEKGDIENGAESINLLLDAIDFQGDPLWAPTVAIGSAPAGRSGLVLSEEAGHDLDLGVGDTVLLRHPVRQGERSYRLTETRLTVVGFHPSPFRFLAFFDTSQAGLFGLTGVTNVLQVAPAPGLGDDTVQRALFGLPGVASVQPAAAMGEVVRDAVDEFQGIFRVIQGFVFILALLVAFNATSINADERSREHATMFAFGLRVRTVLRMSVVESVMVGLLGTLVGCALGATVLRWMAGSLFPRILPELGIDPTLSRETIATALVLGVIAVAAAPLLTLRRLRIMDIPSNLRIME